MEKLTNDGNGNYFYLDSLKEGQKVFQHQLTGTLETVAKDTKIQVEFNPAKVSQYRLIGYANRRLKDEDFANDQIDAGDVGAGHQVTALYEIIPAGVTAFRKTPHRLKYQTVPEVVPEPEIKNTSPELLTVNLRYKLTEESESKLMTHALTDEGKTLAQSSEDFRFSSSVALSGMLLRNSQFSGAGNFEMVKSLADQGTGKDAKGYRMEFRDLLRRSKK